MQHTYDRNTEHDLSVVCELVGVVGVVGELVAVVGAEHENDIDKESCIEQ